MQRIGRRQLLLGAGAGSVALAGLAFPASATAAGGEDDGSLEGAWMVTHTDPTGSAKGVATFAAGGAFASRDINPPGPPQLGAWARTDDQRFVATFWSGVSGGGPSSPAFILKVILHGRLSHDHISGTSSFQAFDGAGNLIGSGSGTFQGNRIKAGE